MVSKFIKLMSVLALIQATSTFTTLDPKKPTQEEIKKVVDDEVRNAKKGCSGFNNSEFFSWLGLKTTQHYNRCVLRALMSRAGRFAESADEPIYASCAEVLRAKAIEHAKACGLPYQPQDLL